MYSDFIALVTIISVSASTFLQLNNNNCPIGQVIIDNVCQQNDITPPKSSIINIQGAGGPFIFLFDFTKTEVIMMIQISNPNWFGFGLGKHMNDAQDMWMFSISSDLSTITCVDSYSNSKSPSLDIDNGGTDDIKLLGYQYNVDGITTVKFKRLLDTQDPCDQVIKQQAQPALWAYGKAGKLSPGYHGAAGTFSFNFIPGQNTDAGDSKRKDWFWWHIWSNLAIWGFAADIGIILARYLKTFNYRMELHGAIMGCIIIITLLAESAILYSNYLIFQYDVFSTSFLKTKIHFIVGLSLMLFVFVQGIGGFITRYQILSKKIIQNNFQFMKNAHQTLGYLFFMIAKLNVIIGLWLLKDFEEFSPQQFWMWITLIGTLFISILIFEYNFQTYSTCIFWLLGLSQNKLKNKKNSVKQTEDDRSHSSLLSHTSVKFANFIETQDQFMLDQEFGDRNWCIFNNEVIDLSNEVHPGGQFIWNAVKGREISRFIYGAYGLENSTIKPWKHSEYAIKMLLKNRVATLREIPFYLQSRNNNDYNLKDQTDLWKLETIIPITGTISYFGFKQNGVVFKTYLNGIDLFGRFFLLSSFENQKIAKRPYTMVLSMAIPNQQFRKQVIDFASFHLKSNLNKEIPDSLPQLMQIDRFDEIPFIIKRYESDYGFSSYLHSQKKNESQFNIKGPYGTSFGLNSNNIGDVVIICGGTGLLPFLDLLDFLLKKTIYDILKLQFGKNVAEQTNPFQINYDNFLKGNCKFYLLVAVQNKDELIGSDIYFPLCRLQKLLPKKNFEMILRIDDGSQFESKANIGQILDVTIVKKQRFDHDFLVKTFPNIANITRYLICGPPTMNKNIPEILESFGVQKNRIQLI